MSTFEPKITRLQPSVSVRSRIKAGREFAKDGRRDEALAEFEAAVRLDPNSKMAHLALGSIKARQRRLDEAVKEYREVLRIDPLHFQGHLRLARVYLAKKETEKALEFANGAASIDPKSPEAMLMVGLLMMAQDDLAGAKLQFSKAIQVNPRLVRARLQMSYVMKRLGNTDEAISQIRAAMRIEPDNAKVRYVLGRLYLSRKDYAGAIEAFEAATELDSEGNTDAILGLAEAFIQSGKHERAEETLRRCPREMESRPRIHKLWGDLHETRGLAKEAVEEYRAFFTLFNKDKPEGTSQRVLADPPEGDARAWKELAASLRKSTDEDREKRRADASEVIVDADE